jgi:hypothetical protein
MTEVDLIKAIEIAEEATNGFADDGSFEHLLAMAVLELKKRLDKRMPLVQVKPWEFNMLTQDKEDILGKPIAWSQWPNKEKNT